MKIEGFFGSLKLANETVQKLKSEGIHNAYVDINDHYIEDRNTQTNLPGTEMSTSLSGLVLESDAHGIGKAKAPLEAASPMVSGLGGFEEIADVNCVVFAEVNGQNEGKAKEIIREMGGSLESPNVRKPKLRDDREITIYNALDEIRENLR